MEGATAGAEGSLTNQALETRAAALASIASLWFMGVVRDRIGELEGQFCSTVFGGSGLLFLAMILVSAARAGVPAPACEAVAASCLVAWGEGSRGE